MRESLRKLLENILVKFNTNDFEIVEYSDGIDFVNKIIKDQGKNNLIKCVLTDENMEYINGSDAIEIVRKLEKNRKIKNIPIASITAFENGHMKDFILKKGANCVLSKPCCEKDLIKLLKEFNILK